MRRRGPRRWRARGGAIVAPDPRAMLALAATPRARRGVVWAALLSCALHVALAAFFAVRWAQPTAPAEIAPIEIALLHESAREHDSAPAPPAPTPPRVVSTPPVPVARPAAPKPVPSRVPPPAPSLVAAKAPAALPATAIGAGSPAAAVGAAPPNAGRGGGGADPVASYVASVLHRIESKKRYPSLAKSRGVEGTVVVTLWISPAGGLERLEVGGGASPLLVSSTRDAIEKASPFPPPPAGMPSIRVPIRYALRSGDGSP